MDITYIPMERGNVYLTVVLDWFSRRVLSWRVSITMGAIYCVETLEDALVYGWATGPSKALIPPAQPLNVGPSAVWSKFEKVKRWRGHRLINSASDRL
jgi:transposase InsO family protein